MGQPPISTGRHIEEMKSALQEERIKCVSTRTARGAFERIIQEEALTEGLMRLKHTPGEQGTHVQWTHPGFFKDVVG